MSFDVQPGDALIVIDPQLDFCPGGALAVAGGDEIMKGIDDLAGLFDLIVITQDWHPRGHASFASGHEGRAPFETTELAYGTQVLWPDHCVQGSAGARFHPDLARTIDRAHLILRKGYHPGIDSYSAFFENDQTTATGLAGYLRDKQVERCVFVGLAYDFCVAWSALDAVRLGFDAVVVKELTRAIAMPGENGTTVDAAERQFKEAGVELAA